MALMKAAAYEQWSNTNLRALMKDQKIRVPEIKRRKSWYIATAVKLKLDQAYIAGFLRRLEEDEGKEAEVAQEVEKEEEANLQNKAQREVRDKEPAITHVKQAKAALNLSHVDKADGSDDIRKAIGHPDAADRNRRQLDHDVDMAAKKSASMGFMTEAKYMAKFTLERLHYYLSYTHKQQIADEDKEDMTRLTKYATSLFLSESQVDAWLANHKKSGMSESVDDGGYSNEDLVQMARAAFEESLSR
ncbi:hypothetical protein BDU57DRAFT_536627 [Ampelomyces quisqualis]|uniref:Uncharacterized protein n=1 Tax=Ampelomyces quisqualis TaxID=50730 RepID=A0A6A5R0R4_AMPQU|nr:hypothetical protein BDU57DRAFT_536627 [Ampelomyces quisqualis]